tara:strand:- start:280 stop:639 length:360 start_codon:yes stop_codon:yes gene_type:complete
MKKLLALLFLSPLTYSQEYVFACETDPNTIATVVINTKEKFITLGKAKFDSAWEKDDITITALSDFYKDQYAVIVFNTVTGEMSQTFYKKLAEPNGETMQELYINQYNYTCKPASRLIP